MSPQKEWPASRYLHTAVFCVCVSIFWLWLLRDQDGYYGILDNFNLLIHEAGHLIFLPFGRTLHLLGGSLLQCLVPAAFVVSFWRTRQPAGVAVSGQWLGENFLNIARYVADARDMALPLLGGGDHDWNTLLGGTFLLRRCRGLGGFIALTGWLIMIAFAAGYVWRNEKERILRLLDGIV